MNLIKLEKAPFLLSIIFAIIAIQFNYIIDNIFETPIIEYEFVESNEVNESGLIRKSLRIKNISTNHQIQNLNLELRAIKNSKQILSEPSISPIPPAFHEYSDNYPTSIKNRILTYFISGIQPGHSYELIFFTDVTNDPIIHIENSQALTIYESSLYTFILRNKIGINLVLLVTFLSLSIVYLLKLNRSEN